jgi:hypothetical protein
VCAGLFVGLPEKLFHTYSSVFVGKWLMFFCIFSIDNIFWAFCVRLKDFIFSCVFVRRCFGWLKMGEEMIFVGWVVGENVVWKYFL